MKTLEIGTISHATMRTEDLLPAFLETAESLDLTSEDKVTVSRIDTDAETDAINGVYSNPEEREYDLWEELVPLLEAYTPPYCYIGSTEGDGSDYGVWPIDPLEIQDSEDVLTCSDERNGRPIPDHILHISDHGNATLYAVELKEVWAVV